MVLSIVAASTGPAMLSSAAAVAPSALSSALAVGRGGAIALATATVASDCLNSYSSSSSSSSSSALRGGACWDKAASAVANPSEERLMGVIPISARGKSVFYMAVAMAFHYFGYSLARPITVALFTSASTGYAGFSAAFPFAMALVSPTALMLLLGYGRCLDRFGPQGALTYSTLACSLVVSASALAIAVLGRSGANLWGTGIPAVKCITGPLFVFRESYVQLLTSQYWSFMASVLTPHQSARWFGPIAGLTSLASAVAGIAVAPLVDRIGLAGALLGTGLMLLGSLVGTQLAYGVARQHGFTPTRPVVNNKKQAKKPPPSKKNGVVVAPTESQPSLLDKATQLFARVPVLKALFWEILASQGLATVLNVCFVAALGEAIPDDTQRAGWVGVFFSVINVITMVLQFGVLPPLMTVIEPRTLWRVLPLVSLLFTAFQAGHANPSLQLVSASLLVMKVSEYSARRMLDEMVFVPLDFDSRFVGKEVIGVFGYRFGKSLMSLALSGLTHWGGGGGEFGLQQLSVLSTGVAIAWMRAAWHLSNLVPTHQQAQDAYNVEHNIKASKKAVPPKKVSNQKKLPPPPKKKPAPPSPPKKKPQPAPRLSGKKK